MFIAALFLTIKTWIIRNVHQRQMYKHIALYLFNGMPFGKKKE